MKGTAKNFVTTLILTCLSAIAANSQTQMASLRPGQEVLWHRTSPSPETPDGPVLYQLLFSSSGTPGTVPMFDVNPRHLINSPIKVRGGNVAIGGLSIDSSSGIVSFASEQPFPASGLPDLVGEVTGPVGATVVSNAVSSNTANAIVRRDRFGDFFANGIILDGALALSNTTGHIVGVITLGGEPFLHNFGSNNTFLGAFAGNLDLSGNGNTGVGKFSLVVNTGNFNSAFGIATLEKNTTGSSNSAFGSSALFSNTTGQHNAAFGKFALGNLVSGSNDIAIGDLAGSKFNGSENNNIDIGNSGTVGESGIIRIGDASTQTAAFIAGISGATSASGVNVFVNSAGQLGTATSSRRFKQEIADLGSESDVLMKLRPVAFYYKPELDSTHTRQYGLVAEEVAQIAPGLVVFDQDGKPQTVRYHFINAMLLNEVQKQKRLIETQQKQLTEQQEQIAAIEQQMKTLMLRMATMERSAQPSNAPEVAALPR